MTGPADAVVALTYRCNAHCRMCNIWQSRQEDRLRSEHLLRLPKSLRTINLSGGEPFMRDDLAEFVAAARKACPRAVITISTNGYLHRRIAERMDDILRIDPSVRLAVSMDGVGAAHDHIRGDEGAFERATKLLDAMGQAGYRGLRLGMTISADNADQLIPLSELAGRRGLELGVVAAHAARTHLGVSELEPIADGDKLRQDISAMAAGWLRSWRPRQWLRAHFACNTYRYLTGRPAPLRCRAGSDFVFIAADGTVFNCSVDGREMGNITAQTWDEIWDSPAADAARRQASRCRQACWMICTARSVYRRRVLSTTAWVAWHKLLAHLGVKRLVRPPTDLEATAGADTSH